MPFPSPLRTGRARLRASGSSLRDGGRSPAARSTRSWFRLTGGFRHPSFGLFSLRRLTSPSVEAANLIAPLRPAGSLHPFRLGIPAVAALSAPLQDGLRFFRHPLPPPLWPFLAVGFPPSTGRMGLTLLSDGEFDRVGCVLPSGGGVVIVVGNWKPTILPAYLLVQATSLLGLFYITDFNGRSLALNLPIPARADPDRGSQVSAHCPRRLARRISPSHRRVAAPR